METHASAQTHGNTSSKLQAIRALAAAAVKTAPDMSKAEESRESAVSPSPVASLAQTESPYQLAMQMAVETVARDSFAKSEQELISMYGFDLATRGLELARTMKPTLGQVAMKYYRAEKEMQRAFFRDLKDSGAEFHQHSVEDFVRVIRTQHDLLARGDSSSVAEVLRTAFPSDEKKAKSIANSTRRSRWKKAYNHVSVRNHPVQILIHETQGARVAQNRLSARTFRNCLSVNGTLYGNSKRINALAERVRVLELQMQSTKLREVLDDAGYTSSKDKVLELYRSGVGPTAIAAALAMSPNTVKSMVQRSKKSPTA